MNYLKKGEIHASNISANGWLPVAGYTVDQACGVSHNIIDREHRFA